MRLHATFKLRGDFACFVFHVLYTMYMRSIASGNSASGTGLLLSAHPEAPLGRGPQHTSTCAACQDCSVAALRTGLSSFRPFATPCRSQLCLSITRVHCCNA